MEAIVKENGKKVNVHICVENGVLKYREDNGRVYLEDDLIIDGKPLIIRNNQDVKDAQQFEIAKEILKWFLREDTRIDRAVKRSIIWSKEFMKQLNEK